MWFPFGSRGVPRNLKRGGHNFRRPIYRPKSSEDQKKGLRVFQRPISSAYLSAWGRDPAAPLDTPLGSFRSHSAPFDPILFYKWDSRTNESQTNRSRTIGHQDIWVPDKWVLDKWVLDKWAPGQLGTRQMGSG